jgi:hypothetical protein
LTMCCNLRRQQQAIQTKRHKTQHSRFTNELLNRIAKGMHKKRTIY